MMTSPAAKVAQAIADGTEERLETYAELAEYLEEDAERVVAIIATVKHMIALIPAYKLAWDSCPVFLTPKHVQ